MPSEIVQFPEGGGAIIHHCRRTVRARCSFCQRPHTKLCDFVHPDNHRCDKPLCDLHAKQGPAPDSDYCEDHPS